MLLAIPLLGVLMLLACGQAGPTGSGSSRKLLSPSSSGKFIPVQEYLKLHPDQRPLSEQFQKLVQAPPMALPPGSQTKPVTISFVYPGEQRSDYWRRSVRSFEARMHALGIDFQLEESFSKAGGVELRKQEAQLKEALDHDPDYLVFTLDLDRHQRLIERILARGRPFLILQNITTPLAIWEGNQPFYVGFDHASGTRMLSEFYLKKVPSTGSYGLLYFVPGYVSSMRGDSFQRMMREGGGASLAEAFFTVDRPAREATLELLARRKVDFLYACTTDVALGAVEGLREAGLTGKVLVNGWGGGGAELEALARGELDVTVMRMNDDNGVAMAEAVRLRLLGQAASVPTVYSGDFALLTRDTSPSEVEALTQRAFRYSGLPEPGEK